MNNEDKITSSNTLRQIETNLTHQQINLNTNFDNRYGSQNDFFKILFMKFNDFEFDKKIDNEFTKFGWAMKKRCTRQTDKLINNFNSYVDPICHKQRVGHDGDFIHGRT